jgi:hypothetical protein
LGDSARERARGPGTVPAHGKPVGDRSGLGLGHFMATLPLTGRKYSR